VPFKSYYAIAFKLGFPDCVERFDGFWGHRSPKSTFLASAYPKGTCLSQDASFEPSTINIGKGVRPIEVRKIKKGRERIDGLWFKKVQQRDITRKCREVP